LKIVINTRFLLADKLEGIGWFSFEVARRLAAAHSEIEFIYAFDRPWDESFITSTNIRPVKLFPPARHPFLFYAYFEWALPRLLAREKPAAFFSPDGFLSLSTPVPTLLTIHDLAYKHFPNQVSWLAQKYYEHYMPRFAQKAARITTVSTYTKADISQQFGIDSQKIDVVHNGANPAYHPLNGEEKKAVQKEYSQGEDYFVYVGSIHPRKNVAQLLRAFELFKNTNPNRTKLLLVGRMAWQTGEVGQVLANMKNSKDVLLLGYLGINQIYKVVGAALANIYVSLFEGFGIPILEAMQAAVPVICSNTSSMPEVAGDAGILVNPDSAEQISQAMYKIYKDHDFRIQTIATGLHQAQQFSWDITAQKVWSSLERVLENPTNAQ
jgi:glycosyltransferase involved in cell wall biosynthesis